MTPQEKAFVALYMKEWVKNNPEKMKANRIRREGRIRGATGYFSADDIADIRKMQKDKCAYCRKLLRGKGHVDHILAIAKGGSNDRRNLQLTCEICNKRKNARDAIEFARGIGLLI